MARFAPVVPTHIARELQEEFEEDMLGEYHLLLAHDVIAKPKEYESIYGRVRDMYGDDAFIIMDNSVVELGSAVNMSMLKEACRIVPPDCLVVPDVMGQGAATRRMAMDFVKEYVQELSTDDTLPPLMGVLQGETLEDCLETLATFYTLPMVEYISVPRIITQKQGSRMPLLIELAKRETYKLFDGVHLLGFSDDLLDDISCARVPFVGGIDSAVPIRAGLKGVAMSHAITAPVFFKDLVGPRGTFWDAPVDASWREHAKLVEANIDDICKWVRT